MCNKNAVATCRLGGCDRIKRERKKEGDKKMKYAY